MRVLVGTAHPLETPQLLVGIVFVMVLVLFFLLLFFRCFALVSSTLRRLLPLAFLPLAILGAQLLRGTMTPNVCHSLLLLLSRKLFSCLYPLLFLLLLFEPFCCSFKLLFVHNEEMAGSAFREVWLSQDVLNTRDWRHLTFVVNILKLVHLIRLIYNPIAFFKVNHLVVLIVFTLLLMLAHC